MHLLKTLAPNALPQNLETVLSASFGLKSPEGISLGLPDFPMDNLHLAAKIMVTKNLSSSILRIPFKL